MITISMEFKHFVDAVELQNPYRKPKFKTVKELQDCMKYFFERAVSQPHLSRRFAMTADTLKTVYPENEKHGSLLNFRKILVTETRSQIDEVIEMLNCASSVDKDRAKGAFKFLGELYGIGFIFIGPLRKVVESLDDAKDESEISKECLTILLDTVRNKVIGIPDDNTGDLKFMKEILKRPTEAPNDSKKPPQSNLLKTAKQFPDLMGSTCSLDGSFSKEMSAREKVKAFEAIVNKLTTDNCADVIRKIETNKKIFDNDSWQSYYDVLIADALKRPHVVEPLVALCQKLPKLGSAWNAVRKEEYQKFIFNTIAKEIEASPTQVREDAITTLFKALVNKSLCSISNVASVLEASIKCSDRNVSVAASVLCNIVEIIKWKFNEAKIQKVSEEIRRKVVKIIETKQLMEDKLAKIKKYLLGDDDSEESSEHEDSEEEEDDDLCDGVTGETTFGIEAVSSCSEDPPSSFVITEFLDEVASQTHEQMKKTVQRSLEKDIWDSTKVAEELLEKILKDTSNITKFLRVATVINSEDGGKDFEKILADATIKRFKESLSLENSDQLTTIAMCLNKLYTIGWISGQSILDCIELTASDEFTTYEKMKIAKDLIKPSIEKLRTECFVDRFTFYFQLLRKRVNEDKSLDHRNEYLELIELLTSLSAVGEIPKVVEDKEPNVQSEFTSKEKKQIELLIDETTKGNFDTNLTVIGFLVSKDSEKIDFLANHIVNRALNDGTRAAFYISVVKKLNDQLNSENQSNYFNNCILNAINRVFANILVDSQISDESFKWIPGFLSFSCELYHMKIVGVNFIDSCLNALFKVDHTCEKAVQCIVQIMIAIGAQLQEENPKVIINHFIYFDCVIRSDPDSTIRSIEYKKLIKLRNNGWKAPGEEVESVVIPARPIRSNSAPQVGQKVEPKIESAGVKVENGSLTVFKLNIEDMSDESKIIATVSGVMKILTSENHVKTFIGAILKPLPSTNTSQRIIALQVKLLKKLSESFSSDAENQIDFDDILVETMNSELARTNALRIFDQSAKSVFTRLMILSGELFKENLLSDDDFAPWLLHKHVNQVPIKVLCDLVERILPKIRNEGTKQLKLALSILEASIHTLMIEMSASIRFDIGEMGKELLFHRVQSLNKAGSPVFMLPPPPPPNRIVYHPFSFVRGSRP